MCINVSIFLETKQFHYAEFSIFVLIPLLLFFVTKRSYILDFYGVSSRFLLLVSFSTVSFFSDSIL